MLLLQQFATQQKIISELQRCFVRYTMFTVSFSSENCFINKLIFTCFLSLDRSKRSSFSPKQLVAELKVYCLFLQLVYSFALIFYFVILMMIGIVIFLILVLLAILLLFDLYLMFYCTFVHVYCS